MTLKLSQRRSGSARQLIGELMRQGIEHPEVLSLAAGFVDSQTLPVEPMAKLSQSLFADTAAARTALQYDTPAGDASLRRQLRSYLAEQDGLPLSDVPEIDRFVITAGANQYLSLVCETLFNPGDICLVAGPTYFVFLGTLHGVLAEAQWIDTDRQGMLPSSLQATLERIEADGDLPRVKAVYIVSDHDNPAGSCPSLERRQQLLDIVTTWRSKQPLLLIEDAAYRALNYGPRGGLPQAEPSFRQLDRSGEAVVYTQTFSKSFSPGLRVGFGCGPHELTAGILDRKANEDFGSPHLNQCLLNLAMQTGMFAEHVAKLCDSYSGKRDAMLSALSAEFEDQPDVRWSEPTGGLYVWVTLPEFLSAAIASPLWQRCVDVEQVMYVAGDLCFAERHGATGHSLQPSNHVRLSFGVLNVEQIREGIQRFAKAVRHVTHDNLA